jgi:hypothetical protein
MLFKSRDAPPGRLREAHPHSHVPTQSALETLAYVKEYGEGLYHQAFQL